MSTAWVTVALEDLNHYLVGAQVSAINTAALGSGQTDRFTRVMTDVVNRIRLKVESCESNQVSTAALTIPPSLRGGACLLIIQGMQASIPSLRLTEDQKAQITTFEKDLDLIAECKLAIEDPTDPLEPGLSTNSPSPAIGERTRNYTRDDQDGL